VDWNNDGKKDLLTGEYNGTVRVYLNTGTDANPAFNGYSFVQVGATNFDAGSYSAIDIADWNSDGLPDLIVGDSTGLVWLLVNTGTLGSPAFSAAVRIKGDSGLGGIHVPSHFMRVKKGDDFISQSGVWETEGFAVAARQIIIHYSGGIGGLKVE